MLLSLLLLARWGLPAVLPAGWADGLVGTTLWSPGLLLTWQLLAALVTVLVVVHRPLTPFRPQGTRSVRDLGRIAGNVMCWLLQTICLGGWPYSHRIAGLRVTEWTGRRLRVGRAALRFAVTYPLLLPWAWLAYLPGLSVEVVAWPLAGVNLALLAASGMILLRHPDRRHLGDLIAGTRVVRVAPPVLGRLQVKWPKPDRRALIALDTLLTVCLTVGLWLGSWIWLQSLSNELKAQQEANWTAVLQKFKNEVLVPYKK
jgi:uncharacterized RDD family membrane protein YckC